MLNTTFEEKETHSFLRNGLNITPITTSYVVNTTVDEIEPLTQPHWTFPIPNLINYLNDKFRTCTAHIEAITKEQVDTYIVKTIGFSSYYGLVPLLGDMSSFAGRAEVSIGFKLYNAVVDPLMAQLVEPFTEVHANNAKYMYYTGTCLVSGNNCEERDALKNPFKIPDFNEKASVLEDFMQFDVKRYVTETSDNLDAIDIKSLFTGGILSAASGNIKDIVYDGVGLTPYMQGYLAKNWINFYVKDWIKAELHTELKSIQDKFNNLFGLHDVPQAQSAPIAMNDVIMPAAGGDIMTQAPSISLVDVAHLQVPLQVVSAEIMG